MWTLCTVYFAKHVGIVVGVKWLGCMLQIVPTLCIVKCVNIVQIVLTLCMMKHEDIVQSSNGCDLEQVTLSTLGRTLTDSHSPAALNI